MARLVTVEPVMFAYMFCAILSAPLKDQLIYKKVCLNRYNSSTCELIDTGHFQYQQNVVQKETATWLLYGSICNTLPAIFSTLILGAWSDRVGRKVVILFPLIGNTLDGVSMAVNAYYEKAPVPYIFIGTVASALFGGFTALLLAVFAYIADITGENRTLRITILESMIFISGTFGELISGVLVQKWGYFITYLLVVGVFVLTIFYSAFILQESYFPSKLSSSSGSRKNCAHLFRKSISVLTRKRPNDQRRSIWILFLIFFFPAIVNLDALSVYVLFAKHSPIDASPSLIGYSLSVNLAIKGIGMIAGMSILSKKFKIADRTLLIFGIISSMAALVFQGLVASVWSLFVSPVIGILSGLPIPIIRSLMSKNVEKNEQGALFSLIASFESLTQLCGSFALTACYNATIAWYHGFTFFVMAATQFCSVFLGWYLQIRTERILAYTKFYQEQKNDVNSNLDSDVEQDTEKEVDYKTGEKENKNPIN